MRSRRLHSIVLFAVVLTLAGCNKGCPPKKETTSLVPAAIEVKGSGDRYIELTAAVAAPTNSGPCASGMLIVAAGNGTQRLLMGNLLPPFPSTYDMAEAETLPKLSHWVKVGSGTIAAPTIAAEDEVIGSDNQTARLANGELMVMWNSSTQSSLPNSSTLSWWSNWGTSDGSIPASIPAAYQPNRDGYRSAELFWRYSCATGWSNPTILDGGKAKATDRSGAATAGLCVKNAPWHRGFDRPELYVDPWLPDPNQIDKQRIYVSTDCSQDDGDNSTTDDNSTQVFMSPDSGTTWDQSGLRLRTGTPLAMTSTSTGRLIMFHMACAMTTLAQGSIVPDCLNRTPILHWSDDHGKSLTTPAPSDSDPGGYDITYDTDPEGGTGTRLPYATLDGNALGVGPPGVPTISLARTGPNGVFAVYPAVEEASVGGTTIKRQVAALVWVVPKANGEAIVAPVKVIRAQADTGSVLMATFIQDDRPDADSATSLLYWLETTSQPTGNDPVAMLARYMTFTNGVANSNETLLSDAAGWQTRNRLMLTAQGDYMKGGFYFHDGTLNFVPVWPQATKVGSAIDSLDDNVRPFIRIISMKPVPPPKFQAEDVAKFHAAPRYSSRRAIKSTISCHPCPRPTPSRPKKE